MSDLDTAINALAGDTRAGPRRRTLVIAQVIGWALISGLMFSPHHTLAIMLGASTAEVVAHTACWGGLGLLCSSALGALYVRLPERVLRGVYAVGIVVAACVLAAIIWSLGMIAFQSISGIGPWVPRDVDSPGRSAWFMFATVRGMLMLGTWSAMFLVVMLTQQVQSAREKTIRAAALMHEAQLQLLRSQLNPHFLFNALNSVIGLIGEEPRRAQQMVRDLARLLRRTLDSTRQKNATVRDEIDFIKLYLRCEKVRFEERLEVAFDVAEEVLSHPLPTMLLQPLVENAVKYGMTGQQPLRLQIQGRIEGRQVILAVRNTGCLDCPRKTPKPGTGTGLKSVKDRLKALFPGDSGFDLFDADGWVTARIRYTPAPWGAMA